MSNLQHRFALLLAAESERALTAEERLERMTRERDEARAQLAAIDTGAPCDGHRHCCADRRRLADELLRVRAERDEARLTFESCNRARRLAEEECDALRSSLERKIRHCDEILEERDALKEKHAPIK